MAELCRGCDGSGVVVGVLDHPTGCERCGGTPAFAGEGLVPDGGSAIDRIAHARMRRALQALRNPFAEEVARHYLRSDERTRSDVEAIFV